MNSVMLLPGVKLAPGMEQKILLIGDYAALAAEPEVQVLNPDGSSIGTAKLIAARAATFAYLTNADFIGQSDPRLSGYANATQSLSALDPAFTIMDTVTFLTLELEK